MVDQAPDKLFSHDPTLDWEGGDLATPKPDQAPTNAWMLSLADLVSLMLTFFVLLFALSGVKDDSWQAVTDALSTRLNPPLEKADSLPTADMNIGRTQQQQAIGLPYLASLFEAIVADTPQLQATVVDLQEDRLILSMSGEDIFAQGGTQVTPVARQLLSSIGGILNGLTNEIGIAAHTSPVPEGGSAYTSNWEFSMARAAAVANILKEVGVNKSFRVYGMAHARFNDIPDLSPAERMSQARRVDVVILPSWRRGL